MASNNHGPIGRIFAGGVGELLDGKDGVIEHALLPAAKLGSGKVAVDAPYTGGAVAGNLCE